MKMMAMLMKMLTCEDLQAGLVFLPAPSLPVLQLPSPKTISSSSSSASSSSSSCHGMGIITIILMKPVQHIEPRQLEELRDSTSLASPTQVFIIASPMYVHIYVFFQPFFLEVVCVFTDCSSISTAKSPVLWLASCVSFKVTSRDIIVASIKISSRAIQSVSTCIFSQAVAISIINNTRCVKKLSSYH